jgi:hypothetical protein
MLGIVKKYRFILMIFFEILVDCKNMKFYLDLFYVTIFTNYLIRYHYWHNLTTDNSSIKTTINWS